MAPTPYQTCTVTLGVVRSSEVITFSPFGSTRSWKSIGGTTVAGAASAAVASAKVAAARKGGEGSAQHEAFREGRIAHP